MREKKAMSMKEAREEAQKLLESANVPVPPDDEEDDNSKSTAMNGPPSTSAVTVRYANVAVVSSGCLRVSSFSCGLV